MTRIAKRARDLRLLHRSVKAACDAARVEGETLFQDRFITGESLIVKGLKGYERIDFEVDAKTPRANERARELADGAYKENR